MLTVAVLVHTSLLALYWGGLSAGEPKTLAGDERAYLGAAERIVAGEPAGLDSLWPPFYAYFLAVCGASVWVAQIAQTVLLLVSALLLRQLARCWLGDGPGVDLAAGLILVYPPLVAFAHYLWPEVLHLALFLAALTLVSVWPKRATAALAAGVTIGFCLLTKSLLLPFVPVLGVALALAAGERWLRAIVAGASGLIATLVLIFALSADLAGSGWFNLWVGLTDTSKVSLEAPVAGEAYRAWRGSGTHASERDRFAREQAMAVVAEQGVVETVRRQLAKQWFRLVDRRSYLTAQLPGGPLAAIGQGYGDVPPAVSAWLRGSSYGLYALVLVGAVWGLTLRFPGWRVFTRGERRWLVLVAVFLLYNLLLFLALHVKSRYRIQLLPFLFLLTGHTANLWVRRENTKPWRLVLATTGSVVLLWLAFSQP